MSDENAPDEHATAHQENSEAKHEAPKPKQTAVFVGMFQKKYVFSILLYLLVALLMFAPIVLNITTVAPGSGGDTYLNLWDVWWVDHALFSFHTSIWFTNLLFWPTGASLVYQTMAPIGSFFVGAFTAISIPFAYNILFFLGFTLSGLTMFILAEYVTKNTYAAFFAGLVFAFSAVHIPLAIDHIDWTNIEWIPLALYFFLRMLNEQKKYLPAVGLGISFVLVTFMGDFEQALMTLMLLGLVFVLYVIAKNSRRLVLDKRFFMAIGIAIVVALIVGAFGYIPLVSSLLQPGTLSNANYLNDIPHNELWSDDLLSFFLPSYYNGFFNGISLSYSSIFAADPSERSAYIGYTVIALALFGLYKDYKRAKLWIAIGVIFGWLALGPYLQVAGNVTPIPGLFYLYHIIPGISVIREPDRFDIVFTIAAAILAAFGVKSLIENFEKSSKKSLLQNSMFVVAIISILFLIESNGYPLTTTLLNQDVTHVSIPEFYTLLGNVTGNFSVLQLPALENDQSALPNLYPGLATYYETAYARPLVGGDVTRTNDTQLIAIYSIPLAVMAESLQSTGTLSYPSPVNENYSNQTILSLYNYKTAFVTVQRSAYNLSSLDLLGGYMQSIFGPPVYYDNSTLAFSTANAINATVFRSYVSYPYPLDWEEVSIERNGSPYYLWEPSSPGLIEVYAPFPNSNDIATELYGGGIYHVNTTITFTALSTSGSPAPLSIYEAQGDESPVLLGEIDINVTPSEYILNTNLTSGPYPTSFLFITQNSTSAPYGVVALRNITFSRQR